MRWIGQLIYDKIARFRNDVYLTSVSESAQDHVVGIDANGKLYKQDVAVGDITAVSFTGDDANTITDSAGSADFTITGGPGITAHMSGSNTINIDGDNASTSAKGVASFSSDNFAVSSGAVTIKSGGVDLTDEVTGVLPSANMDADTAHLSGTQTFTGSKVFQSSTTFQENVFIESSDAGKPFVTIKTTANSTSGSTLQLEKDKGAAGADGDDIANITWRADNAAQELTNFSKILGEIATAADTDEAGKLSFQIAASDGSTSNLRDTIVLTGHSGEDVVDVSVGYGATSTTTVNGILNVSGASSTFDCDTVTFQSSNADDPKIVIQNNTNDNQGARLQLKKNRGAAQVNGDNIAEFGMFGEDSNQNQAQYGKILVKSNEVTDGQESGDFRVQVAAHDGTLTQGLKLVGGSESGEVDVEVGAGTSSVTTITGDLTVSGSDLTFDSVALTAIQTSGETFADNDTSVMTSAAIDDRINAKYASSTISFTGQATMLSSGNWVMPGKPGISSHTWNKDISVNTETNDSTTATIPRQWGHAGVRMPSACIIDGMSCAIVNAGGNRQVTLGLFFARASDSTNVDWGTTNDIGAKLQIHADANNESGSYSNRPTHAEVTGSNIAMAAGDMFYPAIKLTGVTSGGNTDNVYASFTVHVKTLIS